MVALEQAPYTSEYGWIIHLPKDWEPLPNAKGPSLSVHRPVVFAHKDDSDLSLTWMVAGHPMNEVIAKKFLQVLNAHAPLRADLTVAAQSIFPLIGTLDACEIVELTDGNRAIEVLETYDEEGGGELKKGYQLILPLAGAKNYPLMFQRLCFYAPADEFAKTILSIGTAARSFHYR